MKVASYLTQTFYQDGGLDGPWRFPLDLLSSRTLQMLAIEIRLKPTRTLTLISNVPTPLHFQLVRHW